MIKKSIASILIALIFVNSMGCFPSHQVKPEEKDAIEKRGNVKITTTDDQIYYLTDVVVQDSILVGTEKVDEYQNIKRKLSVSEIKTIEVKEFNLALTLVSVIFVGGLLFYVIVEASFSGN